MKRDSATPDRVPGFLEPMKEKLVNSIPPGDWIYEVKLDGYRALALRGCPETRLLSRNQKDLGTGSALAGMSPSGLKSSAFVKSLSISSKLAKRVSCHVADRKVREPVQGTAYGFPAYTHLRLLGISLAEIGSSFPVFAPEFSSRLGSLGFLPY
jgi:hypothetical protein